MLDRRRSGLRARRAAADVRVAGASAAVPRQLRAKRANNNVAAVIGSHDVESRLSGNTSCRNPRRQRLADYGRLAEKHVWAAGA